jgi:TetR/AcrR family transcriptional regulator, transcriptional repressor for nem operon
MTDLEPGRSVETADGTQGAQPGKRERLIAAACQLLHEQGVETTTLGDIARVADVPPGNVYYYFKTKDEIIEAVVEFHLHTIRATLASIESSHRTPKSRLKALVKVLSEQRDLIADYGCPQGSLCSELNKRGPGHDHIAAELMRVPLTWVEDQFRLMGRRDASDLALTLIATYQGTALLTNTLSDSTLMIRESRRLARWIDSLAQT